MIESMPTLTYLLVCAIITVPVLCIVDMVYERIGGLDKEWKETFWRIIILSAFLCVIDVIFTFVVQ